jgi:hypothetical protein
VAHHRFAKITIELVGKIKETGAAAAGPEPNETDVRNKINARLNNLDIGGGYELVDIDIKKYQKTPQTP